MRPVEPARCTIVFDDGVVQSVEGLPSKPVGFGEFYFNMKALSRCNIISGYL